MVGGNGNTGAVTHSRDGITWTNAGSLPMDNHGGSLSVLGGDLVYAGGHNGALFDWVLKSATGASWTQIGTLPMGREYHRAIVVDSTLFLVGGQDTNPTPLPLVTATTDGTSFTADPALPAGRPFGSLALWRGELWSVGGSDMGGVWTSVPGGAWQQRTSNFAPRQGGGLAAFTPR
jgi:N-acetylneuraminic acid mutarotase